MPVVTIQDLDIQFPFEPYDVQKALMTSVIDCVKNRQNGLLESPTGTGKTLSLLCSALAWQRKEKCLARAAFIESAAKDVKKNTMNGAFEPPKVIYASRTHSQLSQAIQELKRCFYKTSKAVVLGSRDLMCIHPDVARLENSSAKILACHVKLQAHTCAYYNSVATKKEEGSVREMTVVDIEDIVQKGKQARFCPFFMSRELVKEADIVFMPYNYLLDPKLRASHGIDLKNSVIILDEGHNVAKICEEAVSFEIRSTLVAACIVEVTRAMNEFSEMSQNQEPGAFGSSMTKDLSLASIMRLKQSFLNLEEGLDKIEVKTEGYLLPGDSLLQVMSNAGFPTYAVGRLALDLDNISSLLTGNNHEATGCDKFGSILRVLSSNVLARSPAVFANSYKVFVQLEEAKGRSQDFRPKDKRPPAKVFNFWCFNPAVGLETMMTYGPRCIMLASGTLSPIPFLVQELMVPFPVQLSNPHIIGDNQLFAGVFMTGPGEARLSSSFQNRNNSAYLKSLGDLITKVCSVVPKGVLVFFPSYSVMDLCVKTWQSTSVWDAMSASKKILLEPRRKDTFKEVMDDYYHCVKTTNGACLMAVCRGKVSEGMDFTDDNGRAVIITGIPYSPARDPHVMAKQQYLDTKVRNGDTNSIRGNDWYQLEAHRALNQAVGRIIRHAQDYGAILLCDERCEGQRFMQNLSQWVRQRVKTYTNFSSGFQDLANFFGASVQKERVQAARLSREKYKTSSTVNLVKTQLSSSMEYMSASLYDVPSDEDLNALYGGNKVVEEFSSGRRAASSSESPRRESALGNLFKKPKIPERKSLGLFQGLDAIAMHKKPESNFVAPIPSPPMPFRPVSFSSRHNDSLGHKRKRIKITANNNDFSNSNTFSNLSVRKQLIADSVDPTPGSSTSSASASVAPSPAAISTEEPECGFNSIPEFWKWVKLSLEGEKYGGFIRAIKKYKTDKDIVGLATQVRTSFDDTLRIQCLLGMSLFLPKEELFRLRSSLEI